MTDSPVPAVPRRRLRTELRRARQVAGRTQDQVANALDWSLSKVIRIETGSVSISTTDLMALLREYGVTEPSRIQELVALARAARQPSWWAKHRENLDPRTLQFIEFEEAAYIIRSFESLLIPGLLQTKEYAEAIISQLGDELPDQAKNARVEVRLTRQRLLEQPESPLAFFILDEAAIRRLTGEKALMQHQLDRLISAASNPKITIEIIPFTAGIHRGMAEPFTILEFPDVTDSDVLYLEGSRDAVISQDEAGLISTYREVFEQLRSISLGPEGSAAYLARLPEEIS